MTKKIKGFNFILPVVLISFLQLSFAYSKSPIPNNNSASSNFDSSIKSSLLIIPVLKSVYDSLFLDKKGLSQQAFDYARQGLDKLKLAGKLLNDSVISIIDFSEPSNKKRLFIIDLKHYKILFNTLVAHGKNTGLEWAKSFSNQNESFKSSPGFYITQGTYLGKNGYSLKLEGMERGINDNAYERGIVIHGAPYVSDAFVNMRGYSGRSQGCPAVPMEVSRPLINTIKNGTCVFIYHPSYIDHSSLLG